VLSQLNLKKEGYFVEFGATNGIDISNTLLLEKEFGWKGILAEPAKFWHESLRQNRPLAFIEEKCIWTESNLQLIFNETENTDLSTLDAFSALDSHRELRQNGEKYEVTTISLIDLLDKYSAPKTIDFLSIDTEGSEFEILNAFDFEKYSFNVIACEHNYTDSREKIYKLLVSKGYIRKYEKISLWDDWYVKAKIN
jgi:FkbM family methyltransferase